jgi:hypothetical protein
VSFETGTGNPTLGTGDGSCENGTLAAGTSCTPVCASGYTLSGPTSCSAAGEVTLSTCAANACTAATYEKLTNPDNAAAGSCAGLTELASGESCEPVCNSGYSLSGQLTTSCTAGTLTLATCVGNACEYANPTPGGDEGNGPGSCKNVVGSDNKLAHDGSCVPDCEAGYSLSTIDGQTTTTCSAGTLTAATCVQDCTVSFAEGTGNPTLGTEVGSCKGGTLAAGKSCTPVCESGYTLSGPTSCSAAGEVTLSTCAANACTAATYEKLTNPDNAAAGSCAGLTELASGESCEPVCNSGYSLSGQLTTSCTAGTLTLATCVGNACEYANPTPGGDEGNGPGSCKNVVGSDKMLAHDGSCVPDCEAGYSLSTIDGQTTTTCSAGTLTAATCVQDCTVSFAEGTGNPTRELGKGSCEGGTLAAGKSCTPECAIGYTLSGPTSCSAAGEVTLSTCAANACTAATYEKLTNPDNAAAGTCEGLTELASGASCDPVCDAGYSLSGQMTTSCTAGTLTLATCVEVVANAACSYTTPTDGTDGGCSDAASAGQLEHGTTCTPTCNSGYSLSAEFSCANGIMTGGVCTADACTAATYEKLTNPDNAAAGTCEGLTELASGESCEPVCNSGYSLSGQLTTSCTAGTLTLATCVGNACEYANPANGTEGTGSDSQERRRLQQREHARPGRIVHARV